MSTGQETAGAVTAEEITTSQDAFHPLRGHVADGTRIGMRDGSVWLIKADMNGWRLLRADGSTVLITRSAHAITDAVVRA